MCELFGFCSESAGRADAMLRSFAGHAVRNPHGWGIAYYDHGKLTLKKGPEAAMASPNYERAAVEAEGRIILSHIRHASCGEVHERNCHPFVAEQAGKTWAFAHNGHIDGISLHPRCGGETDSESAFQMILESIAIHGDPYTGIVKCVDSLFNEYEFGREVRLNFLLSDGEAMYAFNHHPEKAMYRSDRQTTGGPSVVVATQVLDGGHWEPLPEDRVLVVSQGRQIALSEKI
jgi:Predicted glutamine amidotransferase